MSELIQVWTGAQLTGATPPPAFNIPNNPNAKSIKINNQSHYWLLLSFTNTGQAIDRIEPFSYLILPVQKDITIGIDQTEAGVSSLTPDREFVDYSTIAGAISYTKGSTQFSGKNTVDVNSAQISMTATNVTINNQGSGSLTDASGTVSAANTSQTVLAAAQTRKYLIFQNLSTSPMYINFAGTASAGAGSVYIGPYDGLTFDAGFCPLDALNVFCGAAGAPFTCKYN